MSRFFLRAILLPALAAAFIASAAAGEKPATAGRNPRPAGGDARPTNSTVDLEAVKQQVYAELPPAEQKGFQRLGKPKPGEWLGMVRETPQTLADYARLEKVVPDTRRHTVVLQPLGGMDAGQQQLLEALREYAAIFFQLDARIAPPLDLEAYDRALGLKRVAARDRFGGGTRFRYDAGKMLDGVLARNLPGDAAVYLGVTMEELCHGADGVLGLSDMRGRVGIHSFKSCLNAPLVGRASPPVTEGNDAALVLRRACRLLSHETGHMFGLSHCVFFKCAMNGCNGQAEADTQPLFYCPLCARKICQNNAIDPLKRNQALLAFYRKHRLDEEAAILEERMK